MAHDNFQPGSVGELLQVKFPSAVPVPVASAAGGAEEQPFGPWVVPSAELTPPPADALDRKFDRIMRHPDVHHPLIAVDVVGAIWNGMAVPSCAEHHPARTAVPPALPTSAAALR